MDSYNMICNIVTTMLSLNLYGIINTVTQQMNIINVCPSMPKDMYNSSHNFDDVPFVMELGIQESFYS